MEEKTQKIIDKLNEVSHEMKTLFAEIRKEYYKARTLDNKSLKQAKIMATLLVQRNDIILTIDSLKEALAIEEE